MPETKRKTTTSTAVKQRYIDKTYTEFRSKIRNEDFAEIDAFIQSKGWSRADFPEIRAQMSRICDFSFESTKDLAKFLFD